MKVHIIKRQSIFGKKASTVSHIEMPKVFIYQRHRLVDNSSLARRAPDRQKSDAEERQPALGKIPVSPRKREMSKKK